MAINKALQDQFKTKLLEAKNRLESELLRFAKPTDQLGDYETRFDDIGKDADENASEVEEYTDNLALENTLEKELRDVNDALSRMEKGSYGICDDCRQEIDIERLKAYPAARNCIKCK